jgi:hypothetical protein
LGFCLEDSVNVKPGDLAIVVKVDRDYQKCLLGQIIRVTGQYVGYRDIHCWAYEPPLSTPIGGLVFGFYDDELRPIRDPGDDAKDETLIWKPAPQEVSA